MSYQIAILTKKYFNHDQGESLIVLEFVGSGLFKVQFEDGTTDTVGHSSLKISN